MSRNRLKQHLMLVFIGATLLVSLFAPAAPVAAFTQPTVVGSSLYNQAVTTNLITKDTVWQYLDAGQKPASNWTDPAATVSGWKTGKAVFGYGNGGETTKLSFGSNADNKAPVYYFRGNIALPTGSTASAINFKMSVDDGAIVYINGKEAFRTDNLKSGSNLPLTDGKACAEGETTGTIDPALLRAGNNLIAVEVHNCTSSSSDIAFGMSMEATITVAAPTAAPTSAPTTAPTAAPTTTAPTAAPTSGATSVPTTAPSGTSSTIIPMDAVWQYLEGSTKPGSEWLDASQALTNWKVGGALLGYGNGDELTKISYGSNADSKYPVTWFRRRFEMSNAASLSGLKVSMDVDDGAIVYINGKEAFRTPNLKNGSSLPYTDGKACSEGTVEATLDPRLLRDGANIISVEVHNCTASSSDLAFALKMDVTGSGVVNPPSTPSAPQPTAAPTTTQPTVAPTTQPTAAPTTAPTTQPTVAPTTAPTAAPTLPTVSGKQWYVTTSGSSSGDGSMSKPWDLQTAMNHPSAVQPGDTIWVRGGTYRSNYTLRIKGASGKPITLRAYPGERVTIDKSDYSKKGILINDAWYVNVWGIEVTSSNNPRPHSTRPGAGDGIAINANYNSHHVKLINMIIHEHDGMGIGFWRANSDSEVYGSLIYFNGVMELDHGIYTQNVDGYKRIVDNMIFDNASTGIHGYGSSSVGLNNYHIEGNTIFNNGSIGWNSGSGAIGNPVKNILMGGGVVTRNPVITNNMTYYPGTSGVAMNLGYSAGSSNATVTNNWFMGGKLTFGGSEPGLTYSGNTLLASVEGLSGTWNNTKLSSGPSLKIFVRPNAYEAGRANITIYNYGKANSVSIPASQLSGVSLKAGDRYELHNVQNFYGDVVTGTFDGANLVVPMSGHSVAQPAGLNFKPPSSFPTFGAFVLIVPGK